MIKITNICFPLFMKKVNLGVNMTKYQQIFRSVNFFENITFWVRSVNFFENNIFWIRSVNLFVSSLVKSPSGGKNPWKTTPANPRRSLFEKCFKSWFDTVRLWEMSCAFGIFRNYWFRCILRRFIVYSSSAKEFRSQM